MQSILGLWGLATRLKTRPPGAAARATRLRLEPLEGRDAPATLVSPFRVTYQDADGDHVTVTLSKPLLTPANVNGVFEFDVGAVDGDNTTRQQLRTITVGGF